MVYRGFSSRYPGLRFFRSYKTSYLDAVCAVIHRKGELAEMVSDFGYQKARLLVPARSECGMDMPWPSKWRPGCLPFFPLQPLFRKIWESISLWNIQEKKALPCSTTGRSSVLATPRRTPTAKNSDREELCNVKKDCFPHRPRPAFPDAPRLPSPLRYVW